MGTPIGSTLANTFMCTLEQNILSHCPLTFTTLLYRRYVDDICWIFENINQGDSFLQHLNCQHSNITLPHESKKE